MEIQHDKHLRYFIIVQPKNSPNLALKMGSNRSMKELLSTMDPQVDPNQHIEFKEKTHILCARFLGGAWKTVSLEDMKIHRIKLVFLL